MIETVAFFLFWAGLASIVIASLIGKAHISLMLFVPLIPLHNVLYRFHKYPLGKDFIDIALAAMILGWILHTLSSGTPVFEKSPFNRVVLFLSVFSLVSLWQGSLFFLNEGTIPLNPSDPRLQTWKNYMILPLLYCITANNIKTTGQMKWLFLFMFLALIVIDFYTAKQVRYMTSSASRDKLAGTFVWLGPNQVAAFYVQTLFMMLGMFIMNKEKMLRIFLGGLMIISLFITLFLFSRGAYLAIIVGLIMISFMRKRALILPLMVLLVLWQAVLPKAVIERIKETRTSEGTLDSSSQKRLELWKESLKMFASNPVSGVGFDVISSKGLSYGFKDTHNIYVKILAEQGLVGMILFLMLMYLAFKNGVRLYQQSEDTFLQGLGLGFAASVVVVVTTNLFGDRWTYLQVSSYFWVFLGLVARGLNLTEEEEPVEELPYRKDMKFAGLP